MTYYTVTQLTNGKKFSLSLQILFWNKDISMENCTFSYIDVLINHSLEDRVTEDVSAFFEEVETHMTYRIALYINQYWFPILVPIGLVGNTLSFLVMIRPNNRKVSTCIYMAAISINDNIMMCLAFNDWLVTVVNMYEWHPWLCKGLSHLVIFCIQSSTYLILTMTVDKFIAIKWPHKAATYSTPRRAILVCLGVIVCALCYNVPHLFATALVRDTCVAYVVGGLKTKIYSWITFLVNFVIPFSMLIYMNHAIVKAVRSSRKMFRAGEDQRMDKRHRTMKSAENQLTIMLLLVTMLFLILLFPTYLRFIYSTFVGRDTPSKYASSMLFFQITYKLYTTNNGINFFLYCISGERFRNDLKEIVSFIGRGCGSCSSMTKYDERTESTGVSA